MHKYSGHNTIFGNVEISHVWGFGKFKNIMLECVKQMFCLSNKVSPSNSEVIDHHI